MKKDRHEMIISIISENDIETQEDLALRLQQSGFSVTQATVSRDIKELKLTKVAGRNGRQKYALLPVGQTENTNQSRYVRVLKEGYVSMAPAMNILCIKTVPGMAMAVAAALDAFHFPEMVGCIAGDDVIMCANRNVDDTKLVMDKIQRMLQAN